ncbi:MAG: GDSL-type esterase/lipase family protein [Planctomycetota bacterium]
MSRALMIRLKFSLLLFLLIVLMTPAVGAQERRIARFKQAKTVLFLGDSITYGGGYVAGFETWLQVNHPDPDRVVINAGIPSETVSGLSEDGHAGGRFPRPDLDERLDRVLAAIQPDLVIACYGMNCGIYQPLDESRFEAYRSGIGNLHNKVTACGAKLIIVTPPVYDTHGKTPEFDYDEVLGEYSNWLLEQPETMWQTIDLHTAMKQEIAGRRNEDPSFTFQRDSVHPDAAGHLFIASQLINWFSEGVETEPVWPEVLTTEERTKVENLVRQRMTLRRDAWLTETRHERPGLPQGLPVSEANDKVDVLNLELTRLLPQSEDERDVHVGVYYYPWYIEGDWSRHEYEGTPELGEYGTDSPQVAETQIDWCADSGIDSFFVSWWGEDDICARHMRDGLLEASNLERIKFAFIYESIGRLDRLDGEVDTQIDFSNPAVLETMKTDFKLIVDNYFDHPQYLKFGDRPVIAIYLTRTFRNFTPADMDAVRDHSGVDVYVIADEAFFGRQKSPETAVNTTGCFDAVTAYNMLENPRAVDNESALEYLMQHAFPVFDTWSQQVDFIPGVFPSYRDFRGNKRLTGTPEEFEAMLTESLRYSSTSSRDVPRTILVTSFNEWWEGTTIEPAEEYGFGYLEAIHRFKTGN